MFLVKCKSDCPCFVLQEKEYEYQIGLLQNQVTEKESMCEYSAQKLDLHIGKQMVSHCQYSLVIHDKLLAFIGFVSLVLVPMQNVLKSRGPICILLSRKSKRYITMQNLLFYALLYIFIL